MTANFRRTIIQIVTVVIWIGLGIIIFVNFRGHTLIVDNRNVEEAGLEAPDLITVTVNEGDSREFFRGDRDLVSVTGGSHRILVEFNNGSPSFEGRFRLPVVENMYILSIPKMIKGIKPFVEPFYTEPERPQPDDEWPEAKTEILLGDI
ncbi:MAG: hypothetical protein LBG24_06425 [Treponema sp.]|jgi:hypothetical protein|nr:hypothetical protein [Treponema sp.]